MRNPVRARFTIRVHLEHDGEARVVRRRPRRGLLEQFAPHAVIAPFRRHRHVLEQCKALRGRQEQDAEALDVIDAAGTLNHPDPVLRRADHPADPRLRLPLPRGDRRGVDFVEFPERRSVTGFQLFQLIEVGHEGPIYHPA